MYPLALTCALPGGEPERVSRLGVGAVRIDNASPTHSWWRSSVRSTRSQVCAYGSRMLEELRGHDFRVGKRVERRTREHAILARHKRRWKATTDSKHGLPVAPNVVERNLKTSNRLQALIDLRVDA